MIHPTAAVNARTMDLLSVPFFVFRNGIYETATENNIGIFAVSTFNTDYILVKAENFERALSVLSEEGYTIV